MSSQEIAREQSKSFASRVWNYDSGRARRRAVLVAVTTAACLAPMVIAHFAQWRYWQHLEPPRLRIQGLPYYWKDTAIAVAITAVLANAATGFFATAAAQKHIRKQLRSGILLAILFPGVTTLLIDRQYNEHGNSPFVISLFMWLPLMIGAIVGVRNARRPEVSRRRNTSASRAFPPFMFYLKNMLDFTPILVKYSGIVIAPFAIYRLVTFIGGI